MQPREPSGQLAATVAQPQAAFYHMGAAIREFCFLQVESQLQLFGVTSHGRKYHHVVSSGSPTAAIEVYDILTNSFLRLPYEQLKSALLQCTKVSERSHMILATVTALGLTGHATLSDAEMAVTTSSVANIAVVLQQPTFLDSVLTTNSQPPLVNFEQFWQRLKDNVVAATESRVFDLSSGTRLKRAIIEPFRGLLQPPPFLYQRLSLPSPLLMAGKQAGRPL
ncbi:hypothetical protein HPB47_022994 [Ixodes persulcatus]|uniref:Uncharacterized protein n=1 Tax=Ixodes persulcatus TaxID=34615 RepID=A0AC60QAK1_IXOPE|nr:hypothetical protein HPB47_022994 [Ixodes persulcatus]